MGKGPFLVRAAGKCPALRLSIVKHNAPLGYSSCDNLIKVFGIGLRSRYAACGGCSEAEEADETSNASGSEAVRRLSQMDRGRGFYQKSPSPHTITNSVVPGNPALAVSADGDLALGLGLFGGIFGQRHGEHTVFVIGADVVLLDALQAEAAFHAASPALAVQVVVLLLLALAAGVGGNGQNVVIHRQVNLVFTYAGKLRFQEIMVGLVLDVNAEAGAAHPVAHVEKGAEEAVVEQVVGQAAAHIPAAPKGNQSIHT